MPKLAGISMVVAAAVTFALSATLPAHAASTGGIGGRPANPDPNNPRSQSIFIFSADRGENKRDSVTVSNNSESTQTIDLYTVDGIVTNTGAYTCQQRSEATTGIGRWLQLAERSVTLKAGESTDVDMTLRAPNNADVGEHNGCIVFQSATDEGEVSGNVRVRTRQAVRVINTVPGELRKSVSIGTFRVYDERDLQKFELSIKNEGNVSSDVDTNVRLTSLFGQVVYENGGGYPVLSDRELTLNFVNESRPFLGGWYLARADVTYDKRPGQFGTDDPNNSEVVSTGSKLVFVTPHPVAGAIYFAIFLAIIAAILLRRRVALAKRTIRANWTEQTIKKNETIESLAKKHDTSWKSIASANDLKAPYTVTAGQTLRLPNKPDKKTDQSKKAN